MPKISVIIPCYNYARFLPEAVESLVRQTCQDFEVTIVNDGSTDRSGEVAEALIGKYPKQRMRLISQPNKGVCTAKNVGIRASTGNYIVLLDADDKFDMTALEKMAKVLDQNPEVAFAYSWVRCFGSSNQLVRMPEYSFKALIRPTCFINSSSLFRRRVWEVTGGFNPVMKLGWEDMEFWVNAGKHGFYGKLIPEPLLLYRRHPDTRTERHGAHRLVPQLWTQIVKLHPELFKT